MDSQSKILYSQYIGFQSFFREFQSKNHQQIQQLICQTITLSISHHFYLFIQWILLFCLLIGFYFIQLLQLVSLFYLSVVVFCPSKHSHHRFKFRISKNKCIWFVFLHIFQAIFYSNLSFLYLALNHSQPFSV